MLSFECVKEHPTGNEYMREHHWREKKTFFGITYCFACENCNLQVSKKEFIAKKYHIYDQIERL